MTTSEMVGLVTWAVSLIMLAVAVAKGSTFSSEKRIINLEKTVHAMKKEIDRANAVLHRLLNKECPPNE